MIKKVKVGFIGCGYIFEQYIKGCRSFDILDVVAVSDLDHNRAKDKAKEFDVPQVYTVAELLDDPSIELVINLTVPKVHAEVTLSILKAGKHVYSEKPLALTREEGQQILELAKKKKLLVGSAPDTFLGGGLQTARRVLDEGLIGHPIAATAFMAGHGPESWHPNPEFFYQFGAGPLFDMGPYFLTALIHLLGPVKRVTASAQISFKERIATSKERKGLKINVDVPTHVSGILDFHSGAVGTLITSFDTWAHHLPLIEIYGSEGTLSVPNPNTFKGKVLLRRWNRKRWKEIEHLHSDEVGRGIGAAEMAYAIRSGRVSRVSGDLAFHVLDLMESFYESSKLGKHLEIKSFIERPAILPIHLEKGHLDP